MISHCAICDNEIELNETCLEILKNDPTAVFVCDNCKFIEHNTIVNNSQGNFRVRKYD